jgi:hypothetical protein
MDFSELWGARAAIFYITTNPKEAFAFVARAIYLSDFA